MCGGCRPDNYSHPLAETASPPSLTPKVLAPSHPKIQTSYTSTSLLQPAHYPASAAPSLVISESYLFCYSYILHSVIIPLWFSTLNQNMDDRSALHLLPSEGVFCYKNIECRKRRIFSYASCFCSLSSTPFYQHSRTLHWS